MLTKKQIKEIKEHLSRAQNPLFLFDNDPDGLCSFILLQKYFERGKGFPIRSFPGLTVDYFRKIRELNSDYIFILDKPVVSKEFFQEAKKINIPIVWIDHHSINQDDIPEFVDYYNPLFDKKTKTWKKGITGEPVTYLCYQVSQKKEDLWIAVIGCIADKFFPEFYSDFRKKYPDLSIDSKDAFEILYNSQIGKIVKMFSFGLKDKTTNVINMLKFLIKVKTPYDVLDENKKTLLIHKKFYEIDNKHQKFINKALTKFDDGKILFFQYGGTTSMSGELSNELSYKFPDKIIVVIYENGIKANISARGKKIRNIISEAIKELENATGGGHENAVGAQVRIEDVEKFKNNIVELVNKK